MKKMNINSSKIFVIVLSFCLLFCTTAFAFQFEDYKWGITKEEAKSKVKNAKKETISLSPDENSDPFENPPPYSDMIAYKEDIYGASCGVTLVFTPKTKVLYDIIIRWENNNDVGKKAKESLTQKYGKPSQQWEGLDIYKWVGADEYDIIALDYSDSNFQGTELHYTGGKYYFGKNGEESAPSYSPE